MPKRNTSKHMQSYTFTPVVSGLQPDGSFVQILAVNESTADFRHSLPTNEQEPWPHSAEAISQLHASGPIDANGHPLPGTWEPSPEPPALPNGWLFYGPAFLPFWVLFLRWNVRTR